MVGGEVSFGDMSVTLLPGVNATLSAAISYNTPEDRPIQLTDSVKIRLRECQLGEMKVHDSNRTTCTLCDNDRTEFSFDPTAESECRCCQHTAHDHLR